MSTKPDDQIPDPTDDNAERTLGSDDATANIDVPAESSATSGGDDLTTAISGSLLSRGDPSDHSQPTNVRAGEIPDRIGRYRVIKTLGKGGFGAVHLAHDDELERSVAIKVPHAQRIHSREAMEEYLAEARIVAGLDHPHIVPVFDVGHTDDGTCYVVSKFIDGRKLTEFVIEQQCSHSEVANLTAQVAEALHYAHSRGLVHRDVKPDNILVDASGTPFLIDFGLALKEEDYGTGRNYLGTPSYMSPEQARGEGHLVDPRSDVFSLGAVLYLLLSGQKAFRGSDITETLEHIMRREPRVPRAIDRSIPRELERICLKCLAKRASDRFTTALDLAEDLRLFASSKGASSSSVPTRDNSPETPVIQTLENSTSAVSVNRRVHIVPKGLRSFDGDDADFFLALLPGAKDRDGLPESVRFWKSRMAELDPNQTFRVGLIYGPSGCGKSSLVKAGLLPRLDQRVVPIYVEATGSETESRILNGLRNRCATLPGELNLVEALTFVRQGKAVPAGRKVVLILDQFEQWLHAHNNEDTELARALRQCDGENLQCVLMVRDDFWLAASRLMRDLEVEQAEGRNMATVDLFDKLHARHVLVAFGRAFGRLPDDFGELDKEQERFVDAVVDGLAEDGKVVSVRLSLFAEMVKGQPWNPATLKQLGGTSGVGVTFLEETFGSSSAPPARRVHEKAVRRVLGVLLPVSGTNIKGYMRSRQELLEVSGYANRLADFDSLLNLLDTELRLITPTDPEGSIASNDTEIGSETGGEKYYQLTHDYLVHSLREWLTRKQKESWRGRAQLKLAERTELWVSRPESRRLPSVGEWLRIRMLTKVKNWSETEQRLMRSANRYYGAWLGSIAVLLIFLAWGGYRTLDHFHAKRIHDALLTAKTSDLPELIGDASRHPRVARLLQQTRETETDSRKLLHVHLAMLGDSVVDVEYWESAILAAGMEELKVICDLVPSTDELTTRLWKAFESRARTREQRLRAAVALANHAPSDPRWEDAAGDVATLLVVQDSISAVRWSNALATIHERLETPLKSVFINQQDEDVGLVAANVLASYASNDPDRTVNYVVHATPQQLRAFANRIRTLDNPPRQQLSRRLSAPIPENATQDELDDWARQKSNLAMLLLELGDDDAFLSQLELREDARVQTYIIRRLSGFGVDHRRLIELLDSPDSSIRHALIMALGEYGEAVFTPSDRRVISERFSDLFQNDPSGGVHNAIIWAVRQWSFGGDIPLADETLPGDRDRGNRKWYVTSRGQTMVLVDRPGVSWIGSPLDEAGRSDTETRHRRDIQRSFAIASKVTTVTQILAFEKEHDYDSVASPTEAHPANQVSWYRAARYCRWLSEEEGINEDQMCFKPLETLRELENGPVETESPMYPDYLHRTGYRMATEAEWEFACRAGTTTVRHFGHDPKLLTGYAWCFSSGNRTMSPPGLLRPNQFGLFDMLGNCYEWTLGVPNRYDLATDSDVTIDGEREEVASDVVGRMLRGSAYFRRDDTIRSAFRQSAGSRQIHETISFRVARTIADE